MLGNTLTRLLDQRNMKVADLAALTGIPVQTLYSMKKRDSLKVDFATVVKICRCLEVPLEVFAQESSPTPLGDRLSAREWEVVKLYRQLDDYGRDLTRTVMEAEARRAEEQAERNARPMKQIPLYRTPAAAGYASPAFGDDFDVYSISMDSPADFAFRVSGCSMEPLIPDGSIQLVCRDVSVGQGDIGLFFVDGDMKCKQYHRNADGTVTLRSLNRDCADSDVHITPDSGITLECFGRVLPS